MATLSRRGLLLAGGAAALQPGAGRRPNVLLILADDLGFGDLACYGAPDLQTPNIDGLVRSGTRFVQFYSNSPVCSPTRASLMSGRYPDCAGVPGVIRTHPENSWGYLAADAELLPATLRRAGYHTALVGKWHLGLESPNLPNERGFDYFHGFLGDMMDDYLNHRRHGINYMREDTREIDPPGHATDLFAQWAGEYLQSRRGARQPFFLYLAFNAPHVPVQPPPEWLERVRKRQPGIAPRRAALAALIEHMDSAVGKVLAALKAAGHQENTLVIFSSDNGGQIGAGANCGPLRGNKGDMYEGGIRVPAAMAWPGVIEPGGTSERVGITLDLHATVCDAAGVAKPPRTDGVSLLGPAAPDRELFWVRRDGGGPYQGRDYYAARRGDWKLLQNSPFDPYELYNLKTDPRETRDLARAETARYRELAAALARHVQRAGAVPWQRV
ncbi:MAG: sulfatase [Bryobacteraceae bacterium]